MVVLPDMSSLTLGGINWVGFGIVIVITAVAAIVLPRIAVALLSRRLRGRRSADEDVHRRAKRADTLVAATRSLALIGAVVIAVLAFFTIALPGVGSTVLGASLLIAIVGFAAQSVLRDVIAGTMMLFERWFDVGDAITIEPWAMSGVVESISLRSVRLRGLGGESIRIHNQHLYGVRVARGGVRRFALEFYAADAERGRALVRELSMLLPGGPTQLLAPLAIDEEERLGDLTRFVVLAVVPPGREWMIESLAVDMLRQLDGDGGVIRHGPVAYFADPVAEQRFARTVAPSLDLEPPA